MLALKKVELPVLAFAICIVIGLALLALTGDWLWAAFALIFGLIVGDLVEGVVHAARNKEK